MKRFNLIDWKGTILGVAMIVVTGIFLLLLIVVKAWIGFVIYFILWIIVAVSFINNLFMKKIEISEQGVKYISTRLKVELRWEDIKKIGVADLLIGRGGADWIYFSTRCNIGSSIHGKIGEEFIMLRYRKSVIKEIRKYWTGHISDYRRSY